MASRSPVYIDLPEKELTPEEHAEHERKKDFFFGLFQSFGLWPSDVPEGVVLPKNRDYCLLCGKTDRLLSISGRSLMKCPTCCIAQYCSRTCQIRDYKLNHEQLCGLGVKTYRREVDLLEATFKRLDFDIHHDYVHDRYAYLKKSFDFKQHLIRYFALKDELNLNLFRIAFMSESYQAVEAVLAEMLMTLKMAKPILPKYRFEIPFMMLALGKDADAYNFIKFWLSKNVKASKSLMDQIELQSSMISMTGQDMSEDIIDALKIDRYGSTPYPMDYLTFLCLSVLKANFIVKMQSDESDELLSQRMMLVRTLDYTEHHYPYSVRSLLRHGQCPIPPYLTLDQQTAIANGKSYLTWYLNRVPESKAIFEDYIRSRFRI